MQVCGWESLHIQVSVGACVGVMVVPEAKNECLGGAAALCAEAQKPHTTALSRWVRHWWSLREESVGVPERIKWRSQFMCGRE